ncbi:MAG: hypothetical protein KZQ83_13845 [gamma proteobacterium symbiont of Taylorina sp.]|nr:hypothetical protein [gamma proteobacterium symbiont of Taylorina sp.]
MNFKHLQIYFYVTALFHPTFLLADSDFLSNHISSRERISQLLKKRLNTAHQIPICYNYSCRKKDVIYIAEQDIQLIQNIFNMTLAEKNNAHDERMAIAESIAFFEKLAGKQTPVYNDRGKNYNDGLLPGRMDCIDETVNTVHYLQFIANLNVLKWHSIEAPLYRSPWFIGQHWSAHIKDISSGKSYAVDSWEKDNGSPAIVQEVGKWKNREDTE